MNDTNNNALELGTILQGKAYTYTIQKVLGQGTFGITYLATTKVKVTGALGELETTIQVAIKEFFMKEINGREDNTVTSGSKGGVYDKYKKKFAREAENLSKLHHPNIVKVLEYFKTNNTVYYAMEYVEGGNLDAYIAQHNGLPEAECVKYAKQIGSALSYMHAHKMLHLDLKPGNVMLRPNKDAVLIDFGLSKQYDESGNPETSTTVGGGTPGYAPIEQSDYHEGKSFPVTMDVYALGATMFKMLTGVRPPEASVILNDGFPAYELQKHQVSNEMITHIAKAMSALKKDRPQSVEAFLNSLKGEDTSYEVPQEETVKDEPIKIVEVQKASIIKPETKKETEPNIPNEVNTAQKKRLITLSVSAIVGICILIGILTLQNQPNETLSLSPNRDSIPSSIEQEPSQTQPLPQTQPTSTHTPIGEEFVLIEKGELLNYEDYNYKLHTSRNIDISIDSFYISKYELTQGEYERVMLNLASRNYTFPMGEYGDEPYKQIKGDSIPVLGTITDFAQYCNERSRIEGYDGFYTITDTHIIVNPQGNGYRLPTESEWLYAAHAGNLHETYKYAGSNKIKEVAWYGGNSQKIPHRVGLKKPNGKGLYDMSGNVREYVWGKCRAGTDNKCKIYSRLSYYNWVGIIDEFLGYDEPSPEGTRIVLVPKKMNNRNLLIDIPSSTDRLTKDLKQ